MPKRTVFVEDAAPPAAGSTAPAPVGSHAVAKVDPSLLKRNIARHGTARHGTAHSMLAQWSAPATVVTSHRSGGRDGGGEREGRCRPTHRAGDTVLYSQRPEAAAFYPRLAKLLPLHALSTQVSKQAIQPRNAERYEIVQIEAQPHPIGQAHERR
jgi:hypothetical protein